MEKWDNNGAVIYYEKAENGGGILAVGRDGEKNFAEGRPPFAVTTMYGEPGFGASMGGNYRNCGFYEPVSVEFDENKLVMKYRSGSLLITSVTEGEEGACFRQRVTAENTGDSPVSLTALTSASLPVFAYAGNPDPDDYEISYCRQTWYGEGQWKTESFREAGIYVTSSSTPLTSDFVMTSAGTHTTARFYPLLFISDRKRGHTFFMELEPLSSWQAEAGFGRYWRRENGCVAVSCGCAEDRNLHFIHELAPGEKYVTADCVYGVTEGGPQDAVKELYKMRRKRRLLLPPEPTVFFNDYLNGLWADPDEEKCLRMAKLAKEAGADFYITDAGWFCDKGVQWGDKLGDWSLTSNRFSDGIKGFIDKIRALGMRAGLWLEMEVCGAAADAHGMPEDCFICRNGKRIGSGARRFFDFGNPRVREYYTEKISALFDAGVTYIKNDYNESYYAVGGEETYGAYKKQEEFFGFIDEIREKFPGIIMENCASGGMREDGNALSRFALQSVSDQEDYRLYPSIIKGSLINILPEQLGIWAMICPVGNECDLKEEDFLGGEVTVFNMVNGLAGVLYLSGRPDLCDEKNMGLVKSAVAVEREIFKLKRRSVPEYPLGMTDITNRDWDALILSGGDEKLLYVWRLEGEPRKVIPLGAGYAAELIYPKELPCSYSVSGENIEITLAEKYTARLFKLTRK